MVNIFYEDTETLDLDPGFYNAWFEKVCGAEDMGLGGVVLVFCSDSYLLEINQKHLAHDYLTDIITFDYSEGNHVSGDLFVSIDRVNENAIKFNVSRETELRRVVVHGVLHLLGYGDKTPPDVKKMRAMEERALSLI